MARKKFTKGRIPKIGIMRSSKDPVLVCFRESPELEKIVFTREEGDVWKEEATYSPNSDPQDSPVYLGSFEHFIKTFPGDEPFKFLRGKDITKVTYFTSSTGYKGRKIEAAGKLY